MDESNRLSVEKLKNFVQLGAPVNDQDVLDEDNLILQFRIWEQGRVEIDELGEKLGQLVQNALWEVVTEYFLLPNDILSCNMKVPGQAEPMEALNEEFSQFAKEWLEVGVRLRTASVSKITVEFMSHHAPLNSMKELQHQMSLAVSDVKVKTFQLGSYRVPETGELETLYLPCNRQGIVQASEAVDEATGETTSRLSMHDVYFLVARNVKHWQACLDHQAVNAEDLAPKGMRPFQRFQPLVVTSVSESTLTSNSTTPTHNMSTSTTSSDETIASELTTSVFIPRQRLLIGHVFKNSISLYSYNCSRDCIEKLMKQVNNLGHWFSARSALNMSIISQKLGLFHNQPFYRPQSKTTKKIPGNPFLGSDCHVEALVKHLAPPQNALNATTGGSSPKPGPSSTTTSTPSSTTSKTTAVASDQDGDISHVFYNTKPLRPLQQSAYSIERDPTGRHGRQMLEMKAVDKKGILRKLNTLWQNRGDNTDVYFSDEVMVHFKQISRLAHFCYTPLLFLPRWRYEAHSTRLRISDGLEDGNEELDVLAEKPLPSTQEADSGRKQLRQSPIEERDHINIVRTFIQEYVRYLQTLGFINIKKTKPETSAKLPRTTSTSRSSKSNFFDKADAAAKRRSSSGGTSTSNQKLQMKKMENGGGHHGRDESIYLQKSVPGGLLLFEVGVCEPFVYMKLYSLEAARIDVLGGGGCCNSTADNTLVQECDQVRGFVTVTCALGQI
jgi:hypothetical protein